MWTKSMLIYRCRPAYLCGIEHGVCVAWSYNEVPVERVLQRLVTNCIRKSTEAFRADDVGVQHDSDQVHWCRWLRKNSISRHRSQRSAVEIQRRGSQGSGQLHSVRADLHSLSALWTSNKWATARPITHQSLSLSHDISNLAPSRTEATSTPILGSTEIAGLEIDGLDNERLDSGLHNT